MDEPSATPQPDPMTSSAQTSPVLHLVLSFAASTLAFIGWKIIDTPMQRQLARQVPDYLVTHVTLVIEWLVPLAIVGAPLFMLWKLYRRS
jgi:hypothetical protein